MLSVSFSLALVAAMLFGIVLPGHHKEVDKFNGQTRKPIPAGKCDVVSGFPPCKTARNIFWKFGQHSLEDDVVGLSLGKVLMTALRWKLKLVL